MNPFATHGLPSWAEYMALDANAAVAYYSNLFGWHAEAMPMGDDTYHVMQAGPFSAAGIMAVPEPGMPPCWGFYITVEDVDSTAATAAAAGAQVIVPVTDAPGVGRFCGFLDPQGAYLAAMSYDEPTADDPPRTMETAFQTPGMFSWLECRVPDVDKAIAFYTELFGWTIQTQDMSGTPYSMLQVGDVTIGGVMQQPFEGAPPHWGGYVTVRDTDQTLETAATTGGKISVPAFDVPGVGRLGFLEDPQGASLAVAAYQEPAT